MHIGYVNKGGTVVAQVPARNQWGFSLLSCDGGPAGQVDEFPGGFNCPSPGDWVSLSDSDPLICKHHRKGLQGIIKQARAAARAAANRPAVKGLP
jgi:hypothetical protein